MFGIESFIAKAVRPAEHNLLDHCCSFDVI
jgi:hypothetical protein